MDGAVTVASNRNTSGLRPHWKPGQSGNPGGRLSLLQKYIRSETKDGKELADFALQVMRGELTTTVVPKGSETAVEVGPTFGERIQALHWLGERGFGKPKDAPESQDPEDLRSLFNEALIQFGWKVVKDDSRPEGEADAKDRMSDADAIAGQLRNGPSGESE
jgi:hypothetical protein